MADWKYVLVMASVYAKQNFSKCLGHYIRYIPALSMLCDCRRVWSAKERIRPRREVPTIGLAFRVKFDVSERILLLHAVVHL